MNRAFLMVMVSSVLIVHGAMAFGRGPSRQKISDWLQPVLGKYSFQGDAGCDQIELRAAENEGGFVAILAGGKELAGWLGDGSVDLTPNRFDSDYSNGGIDNPVYRKVIELRKNDEGKLVFIHVQNYDDPTAHTPWTAHWKLESEVTCSQ